jgi:nitrite reductase/ring-hydroxylating ferredoxin subunit
MKDTLSGPDLTKGVALSSVAEGAMLLGHAHGEPALLVRRGDALFASGAVCTHYGAPLADGLLVDETVRCPWHQACFSLPTREALRAPALDPVSCWHVEQRNGSAYVGTKIKRGGPPSLGAQVGIPKSVVIVGGGAGATPPQKRSGVWAMPVASRCSAPIRRGPAIARISPRDTCRALHPRSRTRSDRRTFIESTAST